MSFLLSSVVALLAVLSSISYLRQEVGHYFDYVAFAVVFGGTSAAAIVLLPWHFGRELGGMLLLLFRPLRPSLREVVLESLTQLDRMTRGDLRYDGALSGTAGRTFKDGAELLSLGLPLPRIKAILEDRVLQDLERLQRLIHSLRSLSKYPPAFGLTGTVLGLVSLMRSIAAGNDAKQTGLLMAVALVATLYGLLIANLVINPAAEALSKSWAEEKKRAEIALDTIMLAAERANLLEAQEVLNSYLSVNQRVTILGGEDANRIEAA